MSGLYLAHIRAEWVMTTHSCESPDTRGTRDYSSSHLSVEVLSSFAGTDGKLEYWFHEEPVCGHPVREAVLAAGLELRVLPKDAEVAVSTVPQIKWNGRLSERLSSAKWQFGDALPPPTYRDNSGYSREFLCVFRTHGGLERGDANVIRIEDAVSLFILEDDWSWSVALPLARGSFVAGLVQWSS